MIIAPWRTEEFRQRELQILEEMCEHHTQGKGHYLIPVIMLLPIVTFFSALIASL